mmetsp:Transcript_5967/g.9950  ORF Transcript_5967/g.9950 Transcript_5967/m.9950 type:complete len:207 (-) Transcript_5967:225-845(-)
MRKSKREQQDTGDTSCCAASSSTVATAVRTGAGRHHTMHTSSDASQEDEETNQIIAELEADLPTSNLDCKNVTRRSKKKDTITAPNHGTHFHACRISVWIVLLVVIANAALAQYTHTFGRPQQDDAEMLTKIYKVSSNQRVFLRGGHGADGGEMRKGDYYYPKEATLLNKIEAWRSLAKNTTADTTTAPLAFSSISEQEGYHNDKP